MLSKLLLLLLLLLGFAFFHVSIYSLEKVPSAKQNKKKEEVPFSANQPTTLDPCC